MTTERFMTTSLQPASRMQRLLGYDGPVATMLLATFQYFLTSVSFIACLTPVLAFQALVGWQPTHVAIWLGAATLLPVFPAVHGLVGAAEAIREEGASARAGRVFWHGVGHAVRTMPQFVVAVVGLALFSGYDLALLGERDIVLLLVVAAIAISLILAIGVSTVATQRVDLRGIALLTAAASAIVRRPHVACAWLFLAGLAVIATTLPVVGAVAWMFAPAATAVAIRICSRVLGVDALVARR